MLKLVSLTQGLFFVSAFTRDDLDRILATDVLVVLLTGKILGSVPTVHGGLDGDCGRIQLVDDVEGQGPLLPQSEVKMFHSLKMRMNVL